MVANPKYLAKVELLLSQPAGPGASVKYETYSMGGGAMPGVDYDTVMGTLQLTQGATSAMIEIVVRNPYINSQAEFYLDLYEPVNCSLGDTTKTIVLPGQGLRTLLQDSFTGTDNVTFIGHQPEIGQPWAYSSTEYATAPVVTIGNMVHFEEQLPGTSYKEWLYPVSGGPLVKPDFATSWGMCFNSARNYIWAVTRFDYYTETPYDEVESERWLFQEIDRITGQVTGYIEKPNYSVIPRNAVTAPCPRTDEKVNSGNIVYDATDTALWLAGVAMGDAGNNNFARHLWKWNSVDGTFIQATKPITQGQLMLKYSTNGEIWAITSFAGNVGSSSQLVNNVIQINKSTGLVASNLALTFNGLDPATTARVAPAQLAFDQSGRMFCISEPNGTLGSALATNDIARTLFEVDPATGVTTPLANVNGQGRFFYDMLYDHTTTSIVLFAVDDAAFTGNEYMYRYSLSNSTLTLVATLPGGSGPTVFSGSGGDKSRLPIFKLDEYTNVIWYYGRVVNGVKDITAIDKVSGALVHQVNLASQLDPGNLTYTSDAGTDIIVIGYEAAYFNLYASDNASPGDALYDSRAAILRVGFVDGVRDTSVTAFYASPAFPGAGTYSAKMTVSNMVPVEGPGSHTFNLYCYNYAAVGNDFAGLTLDLGENMVRLATNGGEVEGAYDFSALPSSFEVEFRWDMNAGDLRRSLYIEGVVVLSVEDSEATTIVDIVELYVAGVTSADVDTLLVTQGGPPADPMPVVANPMAWYGQSQYGAWSGWNPLDATGTQDGAYPASSYAGRILDDSLTGPVVWTTYWNPAGGNAVEPAVQFPKGPDPSNVVGGNVDWAKGVDVSGETMVGEGFGELALTATVNGVRVPGYLWMTWAAGPQSYATVAWGYSPGDPDPGV